MLVLILLSPYDFLFVFGYRVSFLVSSSVLFSMVIQQLVVILVFLQERSELETKWGPVGLPGVRVGSLWSPLSGRKDSSLHDFP